MMNYIFSDRISGLQPSAVREILKFTADPAVISFAAGNPAPEAFPVEDIQALSAEILQQNPIAALQYSITEGYTPLREATAAFACRNEQNIHSGDQLMITSGGQQGIDLATKVLCNEGDVVLCEDPSFIGALNTFRSYNVRLVGVPMDEDGMNLAALEQALKYNPKAKILYTIPSFQNPSGITTSAEKRREIYRLAMHYGVMILEDNPYGDLRFVGEPVPTIKSLDTEGIVIYLGSFSKILSPGLRVGYAIAPAAIISKMAVGKQCGDVHTNIWAQMLCERFLATRDMERHLERLRQLYRQKSSLMLDEMARHFAPSVRYTRPEGGLFIWATLPAGVDMMAFCRHAIEQKVAVVPGTAFCAEEDAPSSSFRLNFSTPSDEKIVEGIQILGKLTHQLA